LFVGFRCLDGILCIVYLGLERRLTTYHSPQGENFCRAAHHLHSPKGRLYDVYRVAASERFREDVVHSGRLNDSANCGRCPHASPRGGGFQQHLCPAETADYLLRDGMFHQRDRKHGTPRHGGTFLNCIWHFACLAQAETDTTLPVSYDDEGVEREPPTASDRFGYTSDIDHGFGNRILLAVTNIPCSITAASAWSPLSA
jgi:hypothetical protein